MKIGNDSPISARNLCKGLIILALIIAYHAIGGGEHDNDSMALTAADCAQIGAGCYSKKVGE